MKRKASIEALLKRANQDSTELKAGYEKALHDKNVGEDFRVLIKNIFENLRSCLDYIAHDIFETHCSTQKKPDQLYFPIRSTLKEFNLKITKDFPGLEQTAKNVYDLLDSVQPYHDPWLGQFNKLNNHNKHQDLAEQTRTEERRVTVSRDGGSISWNHGVSFSAGIRIMGVPIDPTTQMPVPNNVAKTEVVIWIDFRFKEIDQSVLMFIETSLLNIEKVFRSLEPHI